MIEKIKSLFRKKNDDIGLNILIYSDLHSISENELKCIKNPPQNIDIVILLGDIERDDIILIRKNINPNIPVLSVLGNHDEWDTNDNIPGVINLHEETFCLNGVSFAGISGAYKYKNSPSRCMLTQEESIDICSRLPAADIFVTHDSQYEFFDTNPAHQGLKGITQYINRNKPKIHLFGHHHYSYDKVINGTREICTYKCGILTKDGIYYKIF